VGRDEGKLHDCRVTPYMNGWVKPFLDLSLEVPQNLSENDSLTFLW
jgi:hypothetical protein